MRLFLKDLLLLRRSVSFYLLLALTSLFVGNSFVLAVDIYSKASVAALKDAAYAKGFEPVLGVFVPSAGAYYLLFSLMLPFVVIPLLNAEKENDALFLVVQAGYSFSEILLVKLVVAAVVVVASIVIFAPAVFFWVVWGGHVAWGELLLLFAGYLLYGFLVSSISLFASSVFASFSASAILALAVILFPWVVDFANDVISSPLFAYLSDFSFSQLLSLFEKGVFSLREVLCFFVFIFGFLFMAYFCLRVDLRKRWLWLGLAGLSTLVILQALSFVRVAEDITESRRNSFPVSAERALKRLPPLRIELYFDPQDSRLQDYKREFLDRLLLVKRDVEVVFPKEEELERNYGIIKYCIRLKGGLKCESTYSNSPEEAFQILSKLSGVRIELSNPYPGYPLVVPSVKLKSVKYFYYLLLPSCFGFCALLTGL